MKYLNRTILLLIIIISGLAGIFDGLIIMPVSYTLYFLTVLLMGMYFINEVKNRKNIKINMYFLLMCIAMIIFTYLRDEKSPLYVIGFIAMAFSYYSISCTEMDTKFLNKISLFISILSMFTILLNGFFNKELISGVAFSGRLNPFMYIPYIVIAKNLNKNKKILQILLDLLLCLSIIDIIWSESRAAFLALIFVFFLYLILNRRNNQLVNDKNKKIIKVIFLIVLIFQMVMPRLYIFLYDNYKDELNAFSYKYTEKNFFSGRQVVWNNLFKDLDKQTLTGTGDVLYNNQAQTAHNEFMNIYYCWGIVVAILMSLYIYSIVKIGIKKANSKLDFTILLCYLSVIICTTFETYLYTVHFYIFSTIYMAYLLGKREENTNE